MKKLIYISSVAFLLITVSTGLSPAQSITNAIAQINFAADKIVYDQKTDVITASGNVVLNQNGNTLNAQTVIYDVKTGEVKALGGITIKETTGTILQMQDATRAGD